jgi:uncharacterized membrane protein
MIALWIAAALLLGTSIAFAAWAVVNRRRRIRALVAAGLAMVALVGLAYIVYAMVMFCEAPPGSACA